MSFDLKKFRARDLQQMTEQESMSYLTKFITPEHMAELEMSDWSYTGRVNGRVVVCTGVAEYAPHRGEGWAILDRDCKKEFLTIHRVVRRFLMACPLKRIEATIDLDFPQGHRWVRMLGFKLEAERMKGYRPNGDDAALYALVR